jgi:hypothetical protein
MSCTPPTITVGGVTLSTSDFQNAQELLQTVSGDQGDPTLDEHNENIANGNNSASRNGVQVPSAPGGSPPVQTSLPTPSPIPADQTISTPPPGRSGVSVGCTVWNGIDYNARLSRSFTLRQFTVNAVFPNPLTDYLTYTKQVRFCNLQNLAENIAEPMRAKFGAFNINSAIRNMTSTPSGVSQHITGQAMDIQFSGWTYARYWENAAWIKDNIPYDQFIFEHSSSTGLAWYHLSFNKDGNRPASAPTKVMTMYRNHYDSGLKRYG